jgi:acetyl/propionyl-CoA carboxylase alpha subunit
VLATFGSESAVFSDGEGNTLTIICSTNGFTRFQKMVELAPSTIHDREIVNQVIESAVEMARAVRMINLVLGLSLMII